MRVVKALGACALAVAACTDTLTNGADGGSDGSTSDAVTDASPGDASSDALQGDAPNDAGTGVDAYVPCTSTASMLVSDPGTLFGIAVDDQYVYWANQSTNKVMRAPLGATSGTAIANSLTLPTDVTVDGTYVYYADSAGGHIYRAAKDGGGGSSIANGAGVYGLAAQGSLLFVSNHDNGQVGSMPIGGGTFTPLLTQNFPAGAGASAAGGYFVFGNGDVKLVTADGGETLVASAEANPYDVASDGDHVYWATLYADTIRQAPTDGGPPSTFVNTTSGPGGVAVDAHCVYWTLHGGTGGNGQIWTMAK